MDSPTHTPAGVALGRRSAGALVFFTAGAVLVLEILAVRLLAPYVGVSLETYTAIIGVVLAGISGGTWAGGRLADRLDPRRLLGPAVMAGGLLAVLTLPVVRGAGAAAAGADSAGVLLLALLSFFPVAAVLSAVGPLVAKLELRTVAETGQVVGRLSALGTAGALTGTFLTGFVLLAALPTTPIVVGLGAALVLVGAALGWRLRGGGAGPPAGGLAALLVLAGTAFAAPSPCQTESAYYCASVERDPARPSGRVLLLDTLTHSYVDLRDPRRLEFAYARILGDVADLMAPAGRPLSALHVGGGGFTLPRYLRSTRPGTSSLVLELDPEVVGLARRQLGLRTGPDLRVRTGDARPQLRDGPAGAYDLVVGDAFGGLSVPWHLTTDEFVGLVKRSMRPRGIYGLNLIDYPPLGFLRAEVRTLAGRFRNVALVAPPERLAGRTGGNFVLLASDGPLPERGLLRRAARRPERESLISGARLRRFAGAGPRLRDDYAPVDQLITPAG